MLKCSAVAILQTGFAVANLLHAWMEGEVMDQPDLLAGRKVPLRACLI